MEILAMKEVPACPVFRVNMENLALQVLLDHQELQELVVHPERAELLAVRDLRARPAPLVLQVKIYLDINSIEQIPLMKEKL